MTTQVTVLKVEAENSLEKLNRPEKQQKSPQPKQENNCDSVVSIDEDHYDYVLGYN